MPLNPFSRSSALVHLVPSDLQTHSPLLSWERAPYSFTTLGLPFSTCPVFSFPNSSLLPSSGWPSVRLR